MIWRVNSSRTFFHSIGTGTQHIDSPLIAAHASSSVANLHTGITSTKFLIPYFQITSCNVAQIKRTKAKKRQECLITVSMCVHLVSSLLRFKNCMV